MLVYGFGIEDNVIIWLFPGYWTRLIGLGQGLVSIALTVRILRAWLP